MSESTVPTFVIRFENRKRHLIEVELWLTARPPELTIAFPVWTPGSYMVREYTRNIESIVASMHQSVFGEFQENISFSRSGKNRWFCAIDQDETIIRIRYQLYCREMSVRTNWVERDYAFLTGAATFPFIVGRADQPLNVRLELPSDWQQALTSMPTLGGEPGTFRASSFDELVDSPIVCGNFETREFDQGDILHRLIDVGGGELWDLDRASADTQRIVAHHQEFWGEIPYPRYDFINLVTEGRGGLEHDNSTALMCSRYAMRNRDTYVDWLGLVSHEFFHTWNVRRLRPKALMEYDYEREQHVEELWIAEGITSYFDDLSLARLQLCSADEYLKRLSKAINAVQSSPGRHVQTLNQSSWDAWTKLYRPDENSPNSQISYYSKGAIVSWMLDAEIQRATNGSACLDDLVRALWKRCRDTGYTQSDFDALVLEIAGEEVCAWLQVQLTSTEELQFGSTLDWFGLQFSADDSDPTKKSNWMGCKLASEGDLVITGVVRESPADEAGLNVGDELLAIDGYRVARHNHASVMNCYRNPDKIKILLARRGKIQTHDMQLVPEISQHWQLEFDPKASSDAVARRSRWLQLVSFENA